MLDPRRLRTDLDALKVGIARRGDDTEPLDRAAELDEDRRAAATERDEIRASVKALSADVGRLHKEGRGDEAEDLQQRSRELGAQESALAERAERLDDEIRDILLHVGNEPAAECPDGANEGDNVVVRTVGFDPDSYGDHQRIPHWESAVELGLLDVERATRMSGSMFVMYRGLGARLARALVQLALDRNADAFEEIRPPTLVRTDTMVSSGQLPKFADDAYHLERDDLWAIPTAEVPLTAIASGEILAEADLPARYTAHTSCYRREAGSAGRDTRGLLRVHEFDKVEILAYATPEQVAEVHDDLLARAEGVIADLGLPYRIVDICTGDLGIASARTFDIEVYAPGADQSQ